MPKKIEPEEVEQASPEIQVSEIDYRELYQRLLADQENLRKRFDQDKQQFLKFAHESAVESLLPIVDNFYRATEHVPEENKDSSWLTGILYIQKQLVTVMEGWGVEEIAVKSGDLLDPAVHEAIGTTENTDIPEDHIVTVQNKGYTLNGKVVRPATVITSKHLPTQN